MTEINPRLHNFMLKHQTLRFYMSFFTQGSFYKDTFLKIRRLIKPDDLVLDIGAMFSPYTLLLPAQVIAVDLPTLPGQLGFSQKILQDIKYRNNLNVVIGSAEALPFKNGLFDKVIATEVIEHIPNDDLAISEISRVAKNRGNVFLTTPNNDECPLKYAKDHLRHYTTETLKELLTPHFQNITIKKRLSWRLQNIGYTLSNSTDIKISNIAKILKLYFFWALNDLYYRIRTQNDRGYNLVAYCTNDYSLRIKTEERTVKKD